MNSTPASQKCCCTCEHFGATSKKCGSSIQWEGTNHVCKINAKGYGNVLGCMNSACSKWEPKK